MAHGTAALGPSANGATFMASVERSLFFVFGIAIFISTATPLAAQRSLSPTPLPGFTTTEILQYVQAQDSLLARLRAVRRVRGLEEFRSPAGSLSINVAYWANVVDGRDARQMIWVLGSIQNHLKLSLVGEEFAPLRYHVVSNFPVSYEVLETVDETTARRQIQQIVPEEDFQRQVNALMNVTHTIRSYSTADFFTLRIDVTPPDAHIRIEFSAPGGTLRETHPNEPITGMRLGKYDYKVTAGSRVVPGVADFFVELGRTLSCRFDATPSGGGQCVLKN
jgi:hypothetical protein